jgi:hypothetical protein
MAEANPSLHEPLKRATTLIDCPTTLLILSRLSARNVVKEQIRAQGLRLS